MRDFFVLLVPPGAATQSCLYKTLPSSLRQRVLREHRLEHPRVSVGDQRAHIGDPRQEGNLRKVSVASCQ
eukprot:12901073-Prorocentrum_lima.AAC.1